MMSSVSSDEADQLPSYKGGGMVKTLGSLIRAARKRKGLSQGALGKLVGGISREAVAQWEGGETTPKPDRWGKLCHALDIPVAEFQGLAMGDGLTNVRPVSNGPESDREADINRYILRLVGEEILTAVESGKIEMTPQQFGKLLDHFYLRLQETPADQRVDRARTLLRDMLAIALKD